MADAVAVDDGGMLVGEVPVRTWRGCAGQYQPNTKKPRLDAGAFKFLTQGGDQYFATTGPVQLKR